MLQRTGKKEEELELIPFSHSDSLQLMLLSCIPGLFFLFPWGSVDMMAEGRKERAQFGR